MNNSQIDHLLIVTLHRMVIWPNSLPSTTSAQHGCWPPRWERGHPHTIQLPPGQGSVSSTFSNYKFQIIIIITLILSGILGSPVRNVQYHLILIAVGRHTGDWSREHDVMMCWPAVTQATARVTTRAQFWYRYTPSESNIWSREGCYYCLLFLESHLEPF